MKISKLTQTLFTIMVLPVCGTALTAGAVQLESAFSTSQDEVVAADAFEEFTEEPTADDAVESDEATDETVVKVDDAVTGWNGADPASEMNVGTQLRSSWVMVNREGNLPGQVFAAGQAISKAEVYFVQKGRLISQATTNADGQFNIRGITAGSYTMFVQSNDHYSVSGLLVMGNNPQASNIPKAVSVCLSEESSLSVFQLVTQNASQVGFRDQGQIAFSETADDPTRLYGLKGLAEFNPEASASTTSGNYRVSLDTEGSFVGRLHTMRSSTGRPVDLKSSMVTVLQNNEIVYSTQTNLYGVFSVPGLEPGFYTLVSAGPDGVLVAGFELIPSTTMVTENKLGDVHYTSLQDEEPAAPAGETSFDGLLAPREDIGWINDYMLDHPVYEESDTEDLVAGNFDGVPMMQDYGPGGFGGGGFGGGGGLFSGGGLGGGFGVRAWALPLSAAAIAAVATSDDDNNNFRTPVPVSPFRN